MNLVLSGRQCLDLTEKALGLLCQEHILPPKTSTRQIISVFFRSPTISLLGGQQSLLLNTVSPLRDNLGHSPN